MILPGVPSAVFPLGTCYLPGELVVLRVFEDRYLRMFTPMPSAFTTVLIAQGSEVGGGDRRFTVGVNVQMLQSQDADHGIIVQGVATRRVRVQEWLDDDPFPRATIEPLEDRQLTQSQCHDAASSISLLAQGIRMVHQRIATQRENEQATPPVNPLLATIAGGRWWGTGVSQEEVERAFWAVASQTPCGPLDRHELLQPPSLLDRISRLRATIEHVTEVLSFQMGY